MDEPPRLLERARALTAARRWGEAAMAWADVALACEQRSRRDDARAAWDAAGEAWRRDDRPGPAARALGRAVELADRGDGGAVARVKLAGVLGELGRHEQAEELCREALEQAPYGPVHGLALDTLVGVFQATGQKDRARPLVQSLEATGLTNLRTASQFRAGQLHRMDGELDQAETCFHAVVEALADRPEAASGVAAARGELAELALLRGEIAEAVDFFENAEAEHRRMGRRALSYRCEAGRIRATVEGGLQPLHPRLDEGLAFAEARGMPVLEVDLRIARGMARAGSDPAGATQDLGRAAADADQLGLVLRSGRARYERASRVEAPAADRIELLEEALEQLADAVPWLSRVQAALEEARGDA